MNVVLHPPTHSEHLADSLALSGLEAVTVSDLNPENPTIVDADLLVVEIADQPMRLLREIGRVAESVGLPVLVLVPPGQLPLIEKAEGITDFLVEPVDPIELRIRASRIVVHRDSESAMRFKDLEINPLLYRATIDGEPLDLTFMEYELLRFLVENPVRVWSRQQLLSKVWGYEYYGGARTVDVHIRRLRSKLGEGRASWITTVRSVGYRFG